MFWSLFPHVPVIFQPSVTASPLDSGLRMMNILYPVAAASLEPSLSGARALGGRSPRSPVCSLSWRN